VVQEERRQNVDSNPGQLLTEKVFAADVSPATPTALAGDRGAWIEVAKLTRADAVDCTSAGTGRKISILIGGRRHDGGGPEAAGREDLWPDTAARRPDGSQMAGSEADPESRSRLVHFRRQGCAKARLDAVLARPCFGDPDSELFSGRR